MNDERGAALLKIARYGVERAVGGAADAPSGLDADWLREPGATFVTLRKRGELRGCIGTLTAHSPLVDDLLDNAAASALRDPRFPPVRADELEELRVEVSLLGPLEDVSVEDEEEALVRLSEGRDGWFLTYGSARGTFLPQVWESLPEPRDFLRHLKKKARLSDDFWHPDIGLQRYRVDKWSEED